MRMHKPFTRPIGLAGLGLRRELIDELLAAPAGQIDFLELAPENWILNPCPPRPISHVKH